MDVPHTFKIGLVPKLHPCDIADFLAILSDLRALPFVSNVWVDDEVAFDLDRAETSEVFLLDVDVAVAKDEQETCHHEIVETIGRHASYDLVCY